MAKKQVRRKKWAAVFRKLKRLKKSYFLKKMYVGYYDTLALDGKKILLESQHGEGLGGNIAAITKELCTNAEFREYEVFLACEKKQVKKRKRFLKNHALERVRVVPTNGKKYHELLASAKYLVNDTSFLPFFIKKEGQVYLNTWHGTPLKTLGNKVKNDFAMIGNIQRNMLAADYLLCPNEFTMQHFVDDYMLSNLGATTKLLLSGYPRNEAFFDREKRERIRRECGFGEKQVIAFLPTWRGKVGNVDSEEQNSRLKGYFREIDRALSENQIFYVKLHPFDMEGIDLSEFTHIVPFSGEYETYDFLNAADVLVTDYSSVFFDFALTGRKVVLFVYDKEEYMEERGLYFSLDELPFPQVADVPELIRQINSPKEYDDTKFLHTFCPYDGVGVTRAVLRKFLLGEPSEMLLEREIPDNGKKNVAIFGGGFEKNGITASIINLLHNLDRTKYNYFLVFRLNDIRKRQEGVKDLPEDVAYLGFYHARSLNVRDTVRYMLWRSGGEKLYPYRKAQKLLTQMSKRDIKRVFWNCRIDKAIHFSGYGYELVSLFEEMPCSNTIFVHNDMEREIVDKGNADRGILSHAYRNFDSVAVVTRDLIPSVEKIASYLDTEMDRKTANIVVSKNVINYRRILDMAAEPLAFDEKTETELSVEELDAVLSSDKKKFITIGRFSAEKGHFRLISAFEKLHGEYPDTVLIIIGGYGELFEKTVERARAAKCADSIFIIKYLSNPYTVLKRCDYFVLSSLYEGFGLVLVEADILGVRCFSTDIVGPRLFMEEHGGKLVQDSEEGVLEGMRDCMKGNVPERLGVDYEKYNQEAVAQFESLLP